MKIAYTKDSKVNVVYFSDEVAMKELLPKIVGDIPYIKLKDDVDHYFYDALKISKSKLTIDAEKAKEIQRNHWREARAKKFATLDVEFMRALETNNQDLVKEIGEKKQALRDVTQTHMNKAPEAIKATWPEILL